VKLWESIRDRSDFEVDRNRRSDCTGKREKISSSVSGGRWSCAIGKKEGTPYGLGFFVSFNSF
jgi:hypothetical protein